MIIIMTVFDIILLEINISLFLFHMLLYSIHPFLYPDSIFFSRPYLNAGKREALADYALPVSVIVMSFFGSYVFKAVDCKY